MVFIPPAQFLEIKVFMLSFDLGGAFSHFTCVFSFLGLFWFPQTLSLCRQGSSVSNVRICNVKPQHCELYVGFYSHHKVLYSGEASSL